ncbi:DUF3302 domain containing protein [Lysobacter dokdonensis DS-58]|uniref:DUF3302 domain containing protein n=1 Tax=Lysobacter dokdonensis DS-58 TaxID=1300345 RepID=A0A0A2WPZ3_9GAMM|nr:DUF3293 domain-containing protein [Lysobacter dokdonensis]KGQ20370.1 DUF3302 domain containing protein [Lysobacter dokdonensis DS-58]
MSLHTDLRIATLLDAYYAAEYRWELDGEWRAIRIGQRCPELEAFFPLSRRFGLLSAWDPQSIPRTEAVNRRADESLHAALLTSGLSFRPGFSSAPNRSWREPSWVVMDMPDPEFDRLALRYGQLGTLVWTRGEPVGLRMYATQPLMAKHRDHVEWAPLHSKAIRQPTKAK